MEQMKLESNERRLVRGSLKGMRKLSVSILLELIGSVLRVHWV